MVVFGFVCGVLWFEFGFGFGLGLYYYYTLDFTSLSILGTHLVFFIYSFSREGYTFSVSYIPPRAVEYQGHSKFSIGMQ
jgi:hypothetical protein